MHQKSLPRLNNMHQKTNVILIKLNNMHQKTNAILIRYHICESSSKNMQKDNKITSFHYFISYMHKKYPLQ